MSEKLYKVKPLEWVDDQYGSEADTPFYTYAVTLPAPRGWRKHPEWVVLLNDGPSTSDSDGGLCASLVAGKAACEAHWRERLAKVLEEVSNAD